MYQLGTRDWTKFDSTPVFSLGTGTNYSINELAGMFGGIKTRIPPRPGEVRITLADPDFMKEETNWHAKRSLKKYVRTFIKECKNVQKSDTMITWKSLQNLKKILPF